MRRNRDKIYRCLWLISVCLLYHSCSTDDNSPAFNIPSNQAEIALVEFTTASAASPFYYRILANELIIDWGDKSRPDEYVHFGDQNNWSTIRPIEHQYAESGTYAVNIRTNNPFSFNFSKNDSLAQNSISKITLQTCYSLSELYCRNQPLAQLDLTDCSSLNILDIRSSSISNLILNKESRLTTIFIDSTQITKFDASLTPMLQHLAVGNVDSFQDIQNRDSLHELRTFYVNGKISETNLDLSVNDSLQYLSATNANLERVDLRQLMLLDSISFVNCINLQTIDLESNPRIRKIVLTNNFQLSSEAINNILSALPQTDAKGRYIRLSGNAGDATCDRSIATRKGWIFE